MMLLGPMGLAFLVPRVFYSLNLVFHVEIISEGTMRTSIHWKAAWDFEILHSSERRICLSFILKALAEFCFVIQSLLILL